MQLAFTNRTIRNLMGGHLLVMSARIAPADSENTCVRLLNYLRFASERLMKDEKDDRLELQLTPKQSERNTLPTFVKFGVVFVSRLRLASSLIFFGHSSWFVLTLCFQI